MAGSYLAQTRVVFFDLDDTLVDSEAAYVVGMKAIGIDPNSQAFLQARKQVKDELPSLAPIARSRFHYLKKYLENKKEYSPELHFRIASQYEEAVVMEMKKQWNQLGRKKLMMDLKALGKILFVVTNETLRFQTMKLNAFDPKAELFSGFLTSEEVGCEKPDERIYQLALQKVSARASETLMIGDSFDKDIEPALNLGMRACLTTQFRSSSGKSTHENFRILNDLQALFQL